MTRRRTDRDRARDRLKKRSRERSRLKQARRRARFREAGLNAKGEPCHYPRSQAEICMQRHAPMCPCAACRTGRLLGLGLWRGW